MTCSLRKPRTTFLVSSPNADHKENTSRNHCEPVVVSEQQPELPDLVSEQHIESVASTGIQNIEESSNGLVLHQGENETHASLPQERKSEAIAGFKRPHTDAEQPVKVKKQKTLLTSSVGTCGPYKSENGRRKELENDKWVQEFGSHWVQCAGCQRQIALDKKWMYHLKGWNDHRETCSHITGFVKQKVYLGASSRFSEAGVASISSFFQKKGNPDSEAVLPDIQEPQKQASNTFRVETHTVRATESIAHIFPKSAGKTQPQTPKQMLPTELVLVLCKHLSGLDYTEYILCTQTRDLGGISAEFAARATRKLLPYKNLPKMKRAAKKDT